MKNRQRKELKIFRNVLPIQGLLERILEEILLFRQSRDLSTIN